MKNAIGTGSALERLRKFIPASVQPKFNSVAEWQAWQQEEGRKHCQQIEKQNQRARSEKIFGRAGIQALHHSCSFANYEVTGPEQRQAYSMAKSYAQNFGGGGFASFVFSGAPGTGKNHLARGGTVNRLGPLLRFQSGIGDERIGGPGVGGTLRAAHKPLLLQS